MFSRRILVPLLVLGVLATSLSLAGVTGAFSGSGAPVPPPSPGNRILLFAETPAWGRHDQEFSDVGINVVHSQAELRQGTDVNTRAIILTPETVGKVDRAWIRSLMDQGLVLGGINLSKAEVVAATDLRQLALPDGTPWGIDRSQLGWRPPGDQPFISLIIDGADTGQGTLVQVLADSPSSLRSIRHVRGQIELFVGYAEP